jgi:predicted CoA-binding protein
MIKEKKENKKIIVFGFSDNPDRYSNIAYYLLQDYKHDVIKFNPRDQDVSELPDACDTVTLYLRASISDKYLDYFMHTEFKRIIINPGAENLYLERQLKSKGVEVIHGCTLVMLRTNQF